MARLNPKCRGRRDRCDHNWETRKRQLGAARSHAHPAGPAPPEYEPIRVCTKCGAQRGDGS